MRSHIPARVRGMHLRVEFAEHATYVSGFGCHDRSVHICSQPCYAYLFSCVLLVCPPADLSQKQKEHALTGTTINGGTTVGAQGAAVHGSKAVGPIKPIGTTVGHREKIDGGTRVGAHGSTATGGKAGLSYNLSKTSWR